MSQSLSKLYVHIVFHTKYSQDLIKSDVETELYAYMGAILKQIKCVPIVINGIENHIHILCIQSKNQTLAGLVEEVKRNSSRWIKTKGLSYKDFAWQGGYGGFSVSQSKVNVVKRYIQNQKEHHKKQIFKDEYKEFLNKFHIEHKDEYLFNWIEKYDTE